MECDFHNVTSIHGFTSIITVVCSKTRMLWVFQTAPKRAPVRIIRLIMTTLMNEKQPYKRVRVDEDGTLSNSTDVTNLPVDKFKISMEATGGDASRLNEKNERHNRSIHNMVIAALLGSNQHENKWCFTEEISAEVHKCRTHSALDNI